MISWLTVLLTIHVLCAVLWVGGGVTMHVFGRVAAASGDRQRMNQFTDDSLVIGPRMYAPLSMILLIAGIFLVDKFGADFSDLWITLGFAGWIVSFLIGVLYYPRAGKRRDAVLAGPGIDSPEFLAAYRQVANVNLVELTILLLVVVDMCIKPT